MSRLTIATMLLIVTITAVVITNKNKEIKALRSDIEIIAQDYNKLNHSTLDYAKIYHLVRVAGADHTQAVELLLYSKMYQIEPLIFASLIRSESNFNPNCKHKDKNCKGIGGVNTKLCGQQTDMGAVANVLSASLKRSKGDYREALHRYKSMTPRGLELADSVLRYKESLR